MTKPPRPLPLPVRRRMLVRGLGYGRSPLPAVRGRTWMSFEITDRTRSGIDERIELRTFDDGQGRLR